MVVDTTGGRFSERKSSLVVNLNQRVRVLKIWLLTWALVWNDVLWHKTPNRLGRTSTCPLREHRCNLHIVFGTTPGEPSTIPSRCRFLRPSTPGDLMSHVWQMDANHWVIVGASVTAATARQHPMFRHHTFTNSQSKRASYMLATC